MPENTPPLLSEKTSLTGRLARCAYGGHATVPSDDGLAFFEYRGPGSRAARETCRHCGFYETAHKRDESRVRPEPHPSTVGHKFAQRTFEFDLYYCGCRGWD